ncbi:MAG: ABC transporter permease subunit, partial [Chloroflexota bacterium]
EGSRIYEWALFQSESNPEQLALWLTRTNDTGETEVAFAPMDAPIQDLEVDDPAPPETFEGYVLLQGADRIPFIQTVERQLFGEAPDTAGIASGSAVARPLERRLVYDEEADTFTNTETGVLYAPDESIGEFVAQPLQLVYDADEELLRVPDTTAVYRPDDSGIFSQFGLPYRYEADRGGLFSPASNQVLEEDENGIMTVTIDDTLTPGYRVWIGGQNFERVVEDNFNFDSFEDEELNFFQQFQNAFNGELFTIFIWTFMFAFLSVFTTFWMGLFMAIILDDAKLPGKKIIRSLLIIPYAIPGVIGIVVWQGMLNGNLGIISTTIADFTGQPFFPFQEAWTARTAIIVVNLWLGYPYMMLISSGALQAIPSDIYEAAAVDGASPSERFWQITLPLLLVTMGPLLIASFVFNFNNYLLIEALTAGDPPIPGSSRAAGFTDILISYVYQLAFGSNRGADYGYASAITIIIFFITAGITLVQYRYTRTWEEVGENV